MNEIEIVVYIKSKMRNREKDEEACGIMRIPGWKESDVPSLSPQSLLIQQKTVWEVHFSSNINNNSLFHQHFQILL